MYQTDGCEAANEHKTTERGLMDADELAGEPSRVRVRPRKKGECPSVNPSAQTASIGVGGSHGIRKSGEIATALTPAF